MDEKLKLDKDLVDFDADKSIAYEAVEARLDRIADLFGHRETNTCIKYWMQVNAHKL